MPKGKKIIPSNQHVFICGGTGSGKTYLARKYLASYDYVVVLDTKGEFKWPEADQEEVTLVETLEDLKTVNTPKIIYRPVWEELNEDFYNAFFEWIYRRKNTIVLIDEVMSICPNPYKIPEFYKAILTKGRERNTACWSLSQRPATIPAVIISESMHIFCFNLNLITDREKIVKATGFEEFIEKPGKYTFWYVDLSIDDIKPPVRARLKEK